MSHLGVGYSGANLIPKSRLFPHRCRRCRFTANAKSQRFHDAPNLPLSHNLPDKPHIRPKLDGFSRTCSRFGDKFSRGGGGGEEEARWEKELPTHQPTTVQLLILYHFLHSFSVVNFRKFSYES